MHWRTDITDRDCSMWQCSRAAVKFANELTLSACASRLFIYIDYLGILHMKYTVASVPFGLLAAQLMHYVASHEVAPHTHCRRRLSPCLCSMQLTLRAETFAMPPLVIIAVVPLVMTAVAWHAIDLMSCDAIPYLYRVPMLCCAAIS